MKLSRSRFYAICVFFISVQVHFSIWFFFLVDFTLCVRIQFASEKCVHRHTNISVKQSTKARLLFSFLTFTSEYVFLSNEIRLPIGVQYDPQIGVLFTLIWFFVFGILNLIRQFEEHIVNFNEITLLSIHICFSHFFAVCSFFVPLLCFFVRIICVMPFGAQIVDEMFIDST